MDNDRFPAHRRPTLLLLCLLAAAGCYRGAARGTSASALLTEPGWISISKIRAVEQNGERDCGAAAAAMVLDFWGLDTEQQAVRAASALPEEQALSAGFLRVYLKSRGLQAFLLPGTLADLESELRAGRPVIVGVVKAYSNASYAHYLVVIGFNASTRELAVLDPADGWRDYPFDAFAQEWSAAQSLMLVVSPPAR